MKLELNGQNICLYEELFNIKIKNYFIDFVNLDKISKVIKKFYEDDMYKSNLYKLLENSIYNLNVN